MNFFKKNIFKISYLILIITLMIVFQIQNKYASFNFFERLLGNPLLITFDFLKKINVGLGFIVVITLGTIVFVPLISSSFVSCKNFLSEMPNILSIHNDKTKGSNERLNDMIELMETKNASLFSPISYLFYSAVYTLSLTGVFRMVSEYESIKFLWFDLQTADRFFILPILATLLLSTTIVNSFKRKVFSLKKGKINLAINILFLLLKISLITTCFYSSKTCLCSITVIFVMTIREIIVKMRRRRNETIITTKTEDNKQ